MSSQNKEFNLLQLLHFSQQVEIIGWSSNVWFNGLIIRYPFHFLVYSKNTKYNEYRKEKAKQLIKDSINNKIENLLSLPLEQKDILAYEKILSILDDIILEREN